MINGPLYYIDGDKVYCRGMGGKREGELLKRIVSSIPQGTSCHLRYEDRSWFMIRGERGWLCLPASNRDRPEEVRLKLIGYLGGIEKEVKKRWRLL